MAVKKSSRRLLEKVRNVLVDNPSASLQEIARHSDIGRATLYRHFANREDLVEALALMTFEDSDMVFEKIIEQSSSSTYVLQETIRTYILMGDRYYFVGLSNAFMVTQKVRDRYNAQVQGLYQLIEQVKTEGAIREDLPTAWVARQIDAIILSGIRSIAETDLDSLEVLSLAVETLFDGMGNQAPHEERIWLEVD